MRPAEPLDSWVEEDFHAPRNRMVIAALSLVGLMISVYMLLYALGFLGAIVCGTGGCEKVQVWAIQEGLPAALLGAIGYGAMLLLALLGLQPAFAHTRWIPLLLFGGAVIAFAFTAYLTYLEAYVINAWCRWCIASAIVVLGLTLAALPEFKRLRSTSTNE